MLGGVGGGKAGQEGKNAGRERGDGEWLQQLCCGSERGKNEGQNWVKEGMLFARIATEGMRAWIGVDALERVCH